jgi:hypothetical protein
MNGDDHLLKPEQVAERLSVSVDWVRDHSSRKMPRLTVIRLGGGPGRAGLLRYRASEIEKFIEEMERQSGKRGIQLGVPRHRFPAKARNRARSHQRVRFAPRVVLGSAS